jgi:hypothetical protein
MSAWSSANAALVVKATRPASAQQYRFFRIIGLSLLGLRSCEISLL